MPSTFRIVALSGSLRAGSFNTGLLHAAGELVPDGVEVVLHDYADVPLYNADLDGHLAVEALREAIAGADAVLIASPEYNHSIPGPLKNALDWASRPAFASPFAGKPTAMMSASPGMGGGMRMQAHLQNVLLGMAAQVFPHRGVAVSRAGSAFENGVLVDAGTREFLASFLRDFVAFSQR